MKIEEMPIKVIRDLLQIDPIDKPVIISRDQSEAIL